MDAGYDQEDHQGLQHPQQVLGVLPLDLRHDPLPRPREEQVKLGEGGAEDTANNAENDCRDDGNHVHSNQVFGDKLWLKQPKVSLVFEPVEGRVEKVCCEGGHHATEENLPGEFVFPEG